MYIFHFKGDACNIEDDIFPILAHSRKIGNNNIILWPLTLTNNDFFHYDLTYYFKDPDKISWNNKKTVLYLGE